MQCPACPSAQLIDGRCDACEGAWLAGSAIDDRAARPLEIVDAGRSQRACPVCRAQLISISIFDVPIDQCVAHGMWFDKTEHDEVIKRSHSDEWKLYTGGRVIAPPHRTVGALSSLLDAIDEWRQRRKAKLQG
jgi:Zn-finger nucleic acid-binding protein